LFGRGSRKWSYSSCSTQLRMMDALDRSLVGTPRRPRLRAFAP